MDIFYELGGQEFEWNDEKAYRNERKHGVTFEEAVEVFLDPLAEMADAGRGDEKRDVLIGRTFGLKLLLVVHMVRGERIRLISARPATKVEREDYEEPFYSG